MYQIKGISSLNLRTRRSKDDLKVKDRIQFTCSFCKGKKKLSKDSSIFLRISYELHGKDDDYIFCEKCADVFVDMMRYGPRVVNELNSWQRHSRLIRIFAVQEDMFCFNCLGRADTHVSVQYDDLNVPGVYDNHQTKRVCARCAITFLEMMLSKKSLRTVKLPAFVAENPYKRRNENEFQ